MIALSIAHGYVRHRYQSAERVNSLRNALITQFIDVGADSMQRGPGICTLSGWQLHDVRITKRALRTGGGLSVAQADLLSSKLRIVSSVRKASEMRCLSRKYSGDESSSPR